MADYRTPLPGLLAVALENGVNQVLALDASSVDRLERLEGKVLQLDLEGLAITLYFSFAFGNVEVDLDLDSEQEPDARVSGTPPALFALAAQDAAPELSSNWGESGSQVQISGDAALARDLGKVFGQLEPDWEGPLLGLFGDVAGYQVAQGLKQGSAALQQTLKHAFSMAGQYLNQETDTLAEQSAVDEFNGSVDDLRDGVDRLESRLARVERQRAESETT